MPRVPPEILETSVFLYRTRAEAENGESFGGSGFLMGIRWETNPEDYHVYVITNYHVAIDGSACVIRLTSIHGETICLETDQNDWFYPDRGADDLAVFRLPYQGSKRFRHEMFDEVNLTDELMDKWSFGAGDEVYSIGRLVDIDGSQHNQPLCRFGNVALMPEGPIKGPGGVQQSYIVEMRSRTGFSGSPVYIYIDQVFGRFVDTPKKKPFDFVGPYLLGVHWGQLPVMGPDVSNEERQFGSGMCGVVPCNRLAKLLLENERVVTERRNFEASI